MRWMLLPLLLTTVPLLAQTPGVPLRIDFDPKTDVKLLDRHNGQDGLFVQVRFSVSQEGKTLDGSEYRIVVEEDGYRVKEDSVYKPAPIEDLAVALTIDTSGSMNSHGRISQVRNAARTFLNKLPAPADCGLILFDHEIRPPRLLPARDRQPLLDLIDRTPPRGGTAYLDASLIAIDTIKPFVKKEKAVVLMTDGIDMGSTSDKETVIAEARENKIRLYTVGIGEPGKLEPVNSVLVLDRSGSMNDAIQRSEGITKLKAMQRAASRFVRIMPATARSTVLPFSDEPARPKNFTQNKEHLTRDIQSLRADGGTAVFDAIYKAIAMLDADSSSGKRIVVAMTDGIDNSSRRFPREVIEFARETKTQLFLLGFGKPNEIDQKTMNFIASQSKGEYFHAASESDLIGIFERLSIQIHDDGIDEETLKELAARTGGQYYPAKNVEDLKLILERVTQNIQKKTFEWTFPSLRQVRDGTQRNIAIKLIRRSGEVVSPGNPMQGRDEVVGVQGGRYQTQGVVIAQMDPAVYLAFLAVLGGLLLAPAFFRKRAG